MSGAAVQVTDANFQTEVGESEGLVMLDFWAEWCGPCRSVAPTVTKLAERFSGSVKVGKVDVDANPQLSQAFGIQSIPTFIFFKDGKEMFRTAGAMGERDFTKLLERVVQFEANITQIQAAFEADKGIGEVA